MTSALVQCSVPSKTEDWVPVLVDPDLPPMSCRAGRLELKHGEAIIVETPDGKFLGKVTVFAPPSFKKPRKLTARIVRRATPADEKRHEDTGHLEREIEQYLRRRTRELALELHPFKVRLPLSGRKAVIYFSAEKRVAYDTTLLRRVKMTRLSLQLAILCAANTDDPLRARAFDRFNELGFPTARAASMHSTATWPSSAISAVAPAFFRMSSR